MSFNESWIDSLFFTFILKVGLLAIFTFILYRLFSRLGTEAKSVDTANRWNKSAKPTVGGIVFIVAFILGMTSILKRENFDMEPMVVLFCGVAAFALGFWDDLKRISVRIKLSGQILVAVVFAASRVYEVCQLSGEHHLLNLLLQFGFVVFLVVALMNSVNMLDNMDGVASIAAIPVMLLPLIVSWNGHEFSLWMVAGLIGFLVFNWPRSKVFMGDSGSLLLGFVAAWLILHSRHALRIQGDFDPFWHIIVLLICSCGMFMSDTFVVVFNRLRHGVSPARGGRDHTTHNLVYLGLTEKMVARIFVLLAILQLALLMNYIRSLAISGNETQRFIAVSLVIAYFFLLFGSMLFISYVNLRKGKFTYSK